MIFFDENMGERMPRALKLVGRPNVSLHVRGWIGMKDPQMLRTIGPKRWLLISANKRILLPGLERNIFLEEGVGAVFLTDGEQYLAKVLSLMLRKWDWLNQVDVETLRPFAYFITPDGRRTTQTYKFHGIELAVL